MPINSVILIVLIIRIDYAMDIYDIKGDLHMNYFKKSASRIASVSDAISRYPLSTLFFTATIIMSILFIHSEGSDSHYSEILALSIGGVAAAVGQAVYERFFRGKQLFRWIIYTIVILFITLYYWLFLNHYAEYNSIVSIRSSVLISALIVAYIWIPSINNKFSFSTAFLAAFKGYFTSLLFSIVLEIGMLSVLGAFSSLIYEIDYKIFFDFTVLIFGLFAPLYFFSYIPRYSITGEPVSEKDRYALSIPKILEVMVSYIMIPLIAAYTVILLLYIIPNLGGQFWYDNLLEPLLVSYVVAGLVALFLAERIQTKSTSLFKQFFPKILLVISMFQTLASVLKINQFGLTHGRYYVILFGLFAIISSVIYNFFKNKETYIPALFILFSIVSITPPIDAMTVGLNAQVSFVENILEQNNMLNDHTVVQNESLSLDDREKISNSIRYLYYNDGLDRIDWLPDDFDFYYDFNTVFGFNEYDYEYTNSEGYSEYDPNYADIRIKELDSFSMDIGTADQFAYIPISNIDYETISEQSVPFEHDGEAVTLQVMSNDDTFAINVLDDQNDTIVNFDLNFLLDDTFEYAFDVQRMDAEELTFIEENEQVMIQVIVERLEIHADGTYSGRLYVFVTLNG